MNTAVVRHRVVDWQTHRVVPGVTVVARVVLAVVFAWAGLSKVSDPAASVRAVRAYHLLPEVLARPVGYGLPLLEIALAVLLLVGLGTRLCAIAAGALLVVFLVGIISAAARGLSIDCGCFGGGGTVAKGDTRYTVEILRDTGLLLLAVWMAVFPRSRISLDAAFGLDAPAQDALDEGDQE